MTTPSSTQIYTQGTGTSSTDAFIEIIADVAPSPQQYHYPIGKRWYNKATEIEYILVGLNVVDGVVTGDWLPTATGVDTGILTLTGNSGGAVSSDPSRNINVVGDGTSINIIGNTGTHTLTSNVILPAANSLLYSATSSIGGITLTNGQLPIGSTGVHPVAATLTAGTGISITNGAGSITIASDGSADLLNLTPDSGGVVNPIAGTIQVTGYPMTSTSLIKGIKTYNGGTDKFEINNMLAATPYVVGKNSNNYQYTTIGSAITAALSDGATVGSPAIILITPGTYTENITLLGSIYLFGSMNGNSGSVVIDGNVTYTSIIAADMVIQNLTIAPVSGGLGLQLGGSAVGSVSVNNVKVISSGVTGVLNIDVAGYTPNFYGCQIVAGASASAIDISQSSANFYECIIQYNNTGSQFQQPGTANFYNCYISDTFVVGTATVGIYNSEFYSGSNECIQSGDSTLSLYNSVFSSNHAGGDFIVVSGSNTINVGNILPIGTATKIQTAATTLNGATNLCGNISFDGGNTILDTNGQVWIGATGSKPVPSTITAGAGIAITNAANSITISSTGGGFSWTSQATSFAASSGNGYVVTATSTATLPTGALTGSTISFISSIGTGSGAITVQAATGDKISASTVLGSATGHAISNSYGDSITLTYISAANTWYSSGLIGSWTLN